MQRIFTGFGQVFRKSLLLGLMSLIMFSGLFIFVNPPSYAATKLNPQEKIDRAYDMSEGVGFKEEDRQEAYEKEAQAVTDPNGLDKIYKEDVKAYKKANPDAGNPLEGAKDLIDKVTGKD